MNIHNIKIFKESKRKLKDVYFYSKHLYKFFTNVIEMAKNGVYIGNPAPL